MPKGETAGHADHAAQGGLLAKRLIESIDRDGPLTIAQYMAACLADRRHGYWQKPSTIGGSGDFITAPEISQIFGELIGLWCALVWQSLGEPTGVRLVELGPGRGTLMADALRAARQLPCFLAAASVHLIETSRTQRELQRRTLSSALAPARRDRDTSHQPTRAPAIDWHETLLGVPEGPAIIVANEFLDALPVRQLIFTGRAWHERVVACGGDGLAFATGAKVDAIPGATPRSQTMLQTTACRETALGEGRIIELRVGEEELLAVLARRTSPLVALFIDYGPAEEASGDTLQAVRGHAYVDPLSDPGNCDLSAHVQFQPLRRKAAAAGLAADGPIPQAELLARLGIEQRAAKLMAANPRRADEIAAGVSRLMSPTGMGSLFKALVVRSPNLPTAPAFR